MIDFTSSENALKVSSYDFKIFNNDTFYFMFETDREIHLESIHLDKELEFFIDAFTYYVNKDEELPESNITINFGKRTYCLSPELQLLLSADFLIYEIEKDLLTENDTQDMNNTDPFH